MIKKMSVLIIFILLAIQFVYAEQVKNNGKIKITIGDNYPMITELSVENRIVMVHDNVGADFQMTARSAHW